jgi:hypothetical protein
MGGLPMGYGQEGVYSSIVRRFEPLGVNVVQLWMEGPLRKSLKVVGLQCWPDPLKMYVALPFF